MIPKQLDFYPFEWETLKEEQLEILRRELAKTKNEKSSTKLLRSQGASRDMDEQHQLVLTNAGEQQKKLISKVADTDRFVEELRVLIEGNRKLLAAADAKLQETQDKGEIERARIESLEAQIAKAHATLAERQREKLASQKELESAIEIRGAITDAWRAQSMSEETPSKDELNAFIARYHDMLGVMKYLGTENDEVIEAIRLHNLKLRSLPSMLRVDQINSQARMDEAAHNLSNMKASESGASEILKRLAEEEVQLRAQLSNLESSVKHISIKTAEISSLPYRQRALKATVAAATSTDELLVILQQRFADLKLIMEEANSLGIRLQRFPSTRTVEPEVPKTVIIVKSFGEEPSAIPKPRSIVLQDKL